MKEISRIDFSRIDDKMMDQIIRHEFDDKNFISDFTQYQENINEVRFLDYKTKKLVGKLGSILDVKKEKGKNDGKN